MGLLDRFRRQADDQSHEDAEPVLRATTDTGDSYDDPSEDLLFMLCEELDRDGAFLIVKNVTNDGHYIQVAGPYVNGTYRIERRAGAADSHEHATSPDMRRIHEELTAWAFPSAPKPTHDLEWRPGF